MKKQPEHTKIDQETLAKHADGLTKAVTDLVLRDLSRKYPDNIKIKEFRPFKIVDEEQFNALKKLIKDTFLRCKEGSFVKYSHIALEHYGSHKALINCTHHISKKLKACFTYKKQFGSDILTAHCNKFNNEMILNVVDYYFGEFQKLATEAIQNPKAPEQETQHHLEKARMFNHRLKPLQLPCTPNHSKMVFVK